VGMAPAATTDAGACACMSLHCDIAKHFVPVRFRDGLNGTFCDRTRSRTVGGDRADDFEGAILCQDASTILPRIRNPAQPRTRHRSSLAGSAAARRADAMHQSPHGGGKSDSRHFRQRCQAKSPMRTLISSMYEAMATTSIFLTSARSFLHASCVRCVPRWYGSRGALERRRSASALMPATAALAGLSRRARLLYLVRVDY